MCTKPLILEYDMHMTLHQVAIINAGFTATPEELQHAQRIVDAFAQAGGAGALQLDGKMIDKPHLTQALRLLATRKGH